MLKQIFALAIGFILSAQTFALETKIVTFEQFLQLDKEHEDERYSDKEQRNADPTKVPISVRTKSGIRIGFTNETYATHHNIVYFKKDSNNKLVYNDFLSHIHFLQKFVLLKIQIKREKV